MIILKSFVTPCGIGLYFVVSTFSSSSSMFEASYGYFCAHISYKTTPSAQMSEAFV